MKVLSLNFLTCAVKACKSSSASYPLHPKDAELVQDDLELNAQLLINLMPRIDWPALSATATEVWNFFFLISFILEGFSSGALAMVCIPLAPRRRPRSLYKLGSRAGRLVRPSRPDPLPFPPPASGFLCPPGRGLLPRLPTPVSRFLPQTGNPLLI